MMGEGVVFLSFTMQKLFLVHFTLWCKDNTNMTQMCSYVGIIRVELRQSKYKHLLHEGNMQGPPRASIQEL